MSDMSDIEHRQDIIMQNEMRDMLDCNVFYPDIEHRQDIIMQNEMRDMLDSNVFYPDSQNIMLDDIILLIYRLTI